MNIMTWQFAKGATMEHLGLIPFFLDPTDPRPAREQFDANYISGWSPMTGWKFNPDTLTLRYPGDPPMKPIAWTRMHDERILVYPSAWVMVLRDDGDAWEVSRMD